MREIPTIDIAADTDTTVRLVEGACHDTGFMYISGHGISPDVITRIRNAVVEYFNRPLHDKHADRISRDNYRG